MTLLSFKSEFELINTTTHFGYGRWYSKSDWYKYLGDDCVSWCWLGSNLVNLWRIRAMDPIGLGGGDVDWLSMHASLHVIAATCA